MGAKKVETSRQAWELVQRQHGVVARRQLLENGSSARSLLPPGCRCRWPKSWSRSSTNLAM